MDYQRIIAVANQKGGVGKTTTVENLGYALAQKGRKVLMVDIDPQANLTLGFPADPAGHSTSEVLMRQCALEDAVIKLSKNLFLAPSSSRMADTELHLGSAKARESRLKSALSSATGFDYILIDCPPNLGLLTVNALTAAGEVIVPVEAEFYAAKGAALVCETIEEVRKELNEGLILAGIVITCADERVVLHRNIIAALREQFGKLVFNAVIPKNINIAEAQPLGLSVIEYAPGSKGADAYLHLTREVLKQERKKS